MPKPPPGSYHHPSDREMIQSLPHPHPHPRGIIFLKICPPRWRVDYAGTSLGKYSGMLILLRLSHNIYFNLQQIPVTPAMIKEKWIPTNKVRQQDIFNKCADMTMNNEN